VTTCRVVSVLLAAYVVWLARVCQQARRKARAADVYQVTVNTEQARQALERAQREVQQAVEVRPLPLVILAVAVGYAAKAKN
jgi:hypothetical protein